MKQILFLLTAITAVVLVPGSILAQAPSNDECSGATVISALPFTLSQDTRVATPNATDPALACADGGGGKSVWFKYTPASTGFVTFSTQGSLPDDYDVAMGIYHGACGSLVLDSCNDDVVQGVVRQAEIRMQVQSGTTYTILIAEWSGGGPSGGVPTGGDLLLRVCSDTCAALPPPPIVRGPKSGSVASGGAVSTGPEAAVVIGGEGGGVHEEEEVDNRPDQPLLPAPADVMPPKAPAGSNYKDLKSLDAIQTPASKPVILKNFEGFAGGGFPPDPIMAVGPNHVIAVENVIFRIWDKNGTLLKDISSDSWFANVAGSNNYAGDPQVLYDQFSQRWVMLGFTGTTPNKLLISVSDDDNPIGTWYNWALPEGMGDSATGAFADYPQMGYDENAIYITTREFNPGFRYSRVRIVPKAQLYANTAGPVTWTDFWDLREPDHPFVKLDGIRPSAIFTPAGVHFLVNASPYAPGTFFTVWTIHDPIGSPSITAANVPVVSYTSAPNPGQPGPAGNPFEGGGSVIRHKAVYRDSSLWIAHSIASGTGSAYSSLRYVRLNPFTHTNIEDVAAGLDGYWHFYPALMVDAEKNLMITSTRSGVTEYAGAYVAGHRNSDPPGISDDVTLKLGLGHWDPFAPGSRNRWGDYMGIGLDPVDTTAIWVHTQFASGTNAYKTWVGKTKMAPVPGKFLFAEPVGLNFSPTEKGLVGETLRVAIANYGLDTLTVSAITLPDTNFALVTPPSLPFSLASFETTSVRAVFTPKTIGPLTGSINMSTNDTTNPVTSVSVTGNGFSIAQALGGELYATGGTPDAKLLTVNAASGAASNVGSSGYDQIVSARVHPITHELIGLAAVGANYAIVRINRAAGDAHPVATIPISLLKGMAFKGDTLYVARLNGVIYRVNTSTGVATQVASTGLNIGGLDFNPITGQLWASVRPTGLSNLDRIYKVNLPSGTSTLVGTTGFGVTTPDIVFDANGVLFGLIGSGPNPNKLITIDTASGAGTVVGPLGMTGVQALALRPGTTFPTFTYTFVGDWNMLSVPYIMNQKAKSGLFPNAASSAFIYQGGYVSRDTLDNGIGFWLKFNSSTGRVLSGLPNTNDTIPVQVAWNLVGSLSVPLPVGMVTSIPPGIVISNFFAYQSGGYVTADSILPGQAYWVRVNANGQLALVSSSSAPKDALSGDDVRALERLNSLTVRNPHGNSQVLYFGKNGDRSFDLQRFDMPPLPPEGGFDVRFGSNRMVETHLAALPDAVEFPLMIHSAVNPVTLSWHVGDGAGLKYTLVLVNKRSSRVDVHILTADGSMTVNAVDLSSARLRVEQNVLPTQYTLRQNYPNPFNPITRIRYELPKDELVTLVVYDILGKEVATLVDGKQSAGFYEIPFSGEQVASGIYFYRLTAGKFISVQKMMLLK